MPRSYETDAQEAIRKRIAIETDPVMIMHKRGYFKTVKEDMATGDPMHYALGYIRGICENRDASSIKVLEVNLIMYMMRAELQRRGIEW